MAYIFTAGKFTADDDAGNPLVGGLLYTYFSGTTTPKATYTSSTLATPNTNPVVLDARGEASVWLGSGAYTMVLKTSEGVTVWTEDGIAGNDLSSTSSATGGAGMVGYSSDVTYPSGTVGGFLNNLSLADGAGLVGFGTSSAYEAGTVGAAIQDNAVNILWFCNEAQRAAIKAKTFADDITAVFNTAKTWAAGRKIYLPCGGYKISTAAITEDNSSIVGDGPGQTIIRQSDSTLNLFNVTANNVTFKDMTLQGAAASALTSRFAISTTSATPVTGLQVENVSFTGQDSTKGFTNAIKYNDGCHNGTVKNCYFDRLWGNSSGYGYGVLVGNCRNVVVDSCRWYGTLGRGRHSIYFSSGANRCKAINNHLEGADYEAITIYSQSAQPPCTDNIVAFNTIVGCCTAIPGISTGGISVFGHASGNSIIGNKIRGSKGCGIKVDGTSVTDLYDTTIQSNEIYNPDYYGIDILAASGGVVSTNFVRDAGQSSAGVYAGVRFVSDGTTGSKDWSVTGNRIPASITGRCAFQANANAPAPTGLKFDGNLVGSGTVTDYEFLGSTNFQVDGRLRFTQNYDPPSLTNGASTVSNWSINGAVVGDVVTVVHSENTDGCTFSGQVVSANNVNVTLVNNSGATKNVSAGYICIDIWKRTP